MFVFTTKANRSSARCALESLESRTLMAFGAIDTTFGIAGHTLTPITASTFVQLREIQNVGGKILAAGDGAMARYTAAGTLDTTFGNSGKVIVNVSFKGLDVDSTGRIYILTTNTAGTILLRFSAAGKLGTTYSTAGTERAASAAG